jgi:hypothetical protein
MSGNIFNSLKNSLQDSLYPHPIIIIITNTNYLNACTYILYIHKRSVIIDQQLIYWFWSSAVWASSKIPQALSTCTLLYIVDTPFENATSNETHKGLISILICRITNLGSCETCIYIVLLISRLNKYHCNYT